MDISYIEKMRSSHPSQPESLIWNQASAFSVNLFATLAFTEKSRNQSHENPNINGTSDANKYNSYEEGNSLFPIAH